MNNTRDQKNRLGEEKNDKMQSTVTNRALNNTMDNQYSQKSSIYDPTRSNDNQSAEPSPRKVAPYDKPSAIMIQSPKKSRTLRPLPSPLDQRADAKSEDPLETEMTEMTR